jgi:hypothetical protein
LCAIDIGFAGGRGGEGVRSGEDTKSSKSSKKSFVPDVLALEDDIRLLSEKTDETLVSNDVVA